MSEKRMRVFAGPNGSGKTTIVQNVKNLSSKIPFGVYVNADDIEKILNESGSLSFNDYQLTVNENEIHQFFNDSRFAPIKRNEPDLWSKLSVKNNVIYLNTKMDSYLAADLSEFIRQRLLANGVSFTYETVMSHEGKIKFMKQAHENGYRVYLYFIATEDPQINISRVNIRVHQNGHQVAPELIESRYYKSLQNLKEAVKNTQRAYIWDNSGAAALLIAEITNGIDVDIIATDKVPNWFIKYLVD